MPFPAEGSGGMCQKKLHFKFLDMLQPKISAAISEMDTILSTIVRLLLFILPKAHISPLRALMSVHNQILYPYS